MMRSQINQCNLDITNLVSFLKRNKSGSDHVS